MYVYHIYYKCERGLLIHKKKHICNRKNYITHTRVRNIEIESKAACKLCLRGDLIIVHFMSYYIFFIHGCFTI